MCSTLEEQMITNSGEGVLELAEEAIIVEYKTELECLFDSLISIQLKWKDYQEVLEAPLEEFAYQVNSSRSRSRGRPRFEVSKEQLEFLSSIGFSWTEVASLLGVSRMTVFR